MRAAIVVVAFLMPRGLPARAQSFESQARSVYARSAALFASFQPAAPLTADQKRRALALTFLFENEQPYCLYDYIQDLGDGRGFTGGCIGFNVRSGTMRDIVERYTRKRPNNPLAPFIADMRSLEAVPEIDANLLAARMPGFIPLWQAAARDPLFRQAQDEAVDAGFFDAIRQADDLGVRTALGRAIIYDTLIQHGGEDPSFPDPDSMPPMARRATAALGGGPAVVGEKSWLARFLHERRLILQNPNDPTTKGAWATSTDRVDTFLMLMSQGNMDLRGPIDTNPWFNAVIP